MAVESENATYFRVEAQRMIETVRMYILHSPDFTSFDSCQNWTTALVLITRAKPEQLWDMVEGLFPAGDAVQVQASQYRRLAESSTRVYEGIRSTAVRMLWEESPRWNFKK